MILSCFPARHTKRWLEKQLGNQGEKKKRSEELEDPACERRIKCKRKLEGVSWSPREQNGYTVTFMKVWIFPCFFFKDLHILSSQICWMAITKNMLLSQSGVWGPGTTAAHSDFSWDVSLSLMGYSPPHVLTFFLRMSSYKDSTQTGLETYHNKLPLPNIVTFGSGRVRISAWESGKSTI